MLFKIQGHPNVLSTHSTTLEFTKDSHLTKKGDCILGVKATFDASKLKDLVQQYDTVHIIISIDGLEEKIVGETNKEYDHGHEMVIRKSDFISDRTFAIRADKAAIDLNKELVERLKNPDNSASVQVQGI